MVVTTVLLLLAAACPLFEKDIRVPYLFTLSLDPPATTPHQLPDQHTLSATSEELSKAETKKITDQDFLSLDMIGFDSLAKAMQSVSARVALAGKPVIHSLESGKRFDTNAATRR